MTAMTRPASEPSTEQTRWRTLDIVVVAVIGVSFGVVFWAWNVVWGLTGPLFAAVPPAQYLFSGVWLIPAVLAPLIVRKPGAALFAELVAAALSAALGSLWGLDAILSGFAQGAAAELAFAFTLYRVWSLPVALLAGAAAAVGEALHDLPVYYPTMPLEFQAAVAAAMLASGVLIAGLGGWGLYGALRRSGVLRAFPADEPPG
jgi:energy-coupling factor transport system substrate-specific component